MPHCRFELGYGAMGDVNAQSEAVVDWKEPYRAGVIGYMQGGWVRGVVLWNVWNQADTARQLIDARGPFRPADL